MKMKILTPVPYLAVLVADFYLLPFAIGDTGAAMLFLLAVIPIICLIDSLAYGMCHGFSLLMPIATAVFFTPTVWLYYNESAAIYIIFYTVVSLIGVAVGRLFYKKR